ncbi:MAG: hypothetical protein ACREMP_04230 [Candidatus Tyrphobacter sp.]
MRGARALLAASTAFVLLLISLSPAAYAATSPSQAAQIRALKARLSALQRRYDAQQRQIDRLEHEFDQAFGAQRHHAVPAVAARHRHAPPLVAARRHRAAARRLTVGVTRTPTPVATPAPVAAPPPQPAAAAQQAPPTQRQLGGAAPRTQSVKAVYQQQNALFVHGLTLTPALQYSYTDNRLFTLNGFLALGAIFLGNIDVTRQENTIVEPSITADYSYSPRQEVELSVPWVWRASTYDAQGSQNSTALVSQNLIAVGRFGDISAGYYYQLPQSAPGAPIVVLNGRLSIPTGLPPYGIKIIQTKQNGGNLSYPSTLPTGTGLYTFSLGGTIIAQADPAILFAGVNLYHNFTGHFADISTSQTSTQPGSIAGGDAALITLGTAFSLNDKVSTSFSLQDTIVTPTRERPDGGKWSTVIGSTLNAAVFNIGTTYSTSPTTYWQAIVGIGMTQDAPNFSLNLRFPQIH